MQEQTDSDLDTIKMVTALSSREDPIDAALQVADRIKQQLGSPPDLLIIFATIHYARRMGMIADTLRDKLSSAHMLGVTASGVMSGATEIEEGPGLSVMACRFPGVQINPFSKGFNGDPSCSSFRSDRCDRRYARDLVLC
jgi:small ligand-binding sensory domain FIST